MGLFLLCLGLAIAGFAVAWKGSHMALTRGGLLLIGAGLVLLLLSLLLATRIEALEIDVAASSIDDPDRDEAQRQIVATGAQKVTWSRTTLALSGKYIRSDGRPAAYEIAARSTARWQNGLTLTLDAIRLQTHDTFSGGLGVGAGWFSLTAGARAEYRSGRDTFAKLALDATPTLGILEVGGHLEMLGNGQDGRVDYRIEARVPSGHFYAAVRHSRIRRVRENTLSLGVHF
ncbi:MAG: hypothetical protein ABIJ95_03185 [Pseudomonadota bacterium]